MGIWRLLGRFVKISDKENWFITDDTRGRLIYEEFDQTVGKSSKKSKFFVVNYAKVFGKKKTDGQEVQAVVEVDLNDKEMAVDLDAG